ncbi:MAG: hypothetical protein PHR28_02420 [candidate division Zixibacteria bacterium]|nr:hypothetical protein [candidate division Zixibacteria bacterium]
MTNRLTIYLCLLLMAGGSSLMAQTTLNPDISLVGDIRAFTHNDASRPGEKNEFNLQMPAMELVVAGYLNPYARADAVVAWEGEENASVEELYATILRGLPLGLNLRVGKYRLEFGRLNPVHPHAYSFMDAPLPHQEYFGEEGLNDMAIRASVAVPTGHFNTEIMGAVLKGEILRVDGVTEPETDSTQDEIRIKPGFFGRVTTSAAVSENAEFTMGASMVTAEYDPVAALRAWVSGVDAKYKWRPNRNTSLTVEGEALRNHRELPENKTVTSYGAYGYIDYRFHQKYNLGSIYEFAQGALDEESSVSRIGGFVGFAPIEETSLVRILANYAKPKGADGFWTVTVQFVFSLGPHQPHNF